MSQLNHLRSSSFAVAATRFSPPLQPPRRPCSLLQHRCDLLLFFLSFSASGVFQSSLRRRTLLLASGAGIGVVSPVAGAQLPKGERVAGGEVEGVGPAVREDSAGRSERCLWRFTVATWYIHMTLQACGAAHSPPYVQYRRLCSAAVRPALRCALYSTIRRPSRKKRCTWVILLLL
jgi:hypothetical protein